MITPFFIRPIVSSNVLEERLYIESDRPLTADDLTKIRFLFADHGNKEGFRKGHSFLGKQSVIEIGPLQTMRTAFSSNAEAACKDMGIRGIRRIEKTRCFRSAKESQIDKMTQQIYVGDINFTGKQKPESNIIVPTLTEGHTALEVINKQRGLGMDADDLQNLMKISKEMGRNLNHHEVGTFAIMGSDHSRHGTWGAHRIIDGTNQKMTLMQIMKSTTTPSRNNMIVFHDNSSALRGSNTQVLLPNDPLKPSVYRYRIELLHPTFTAETHNFPCQWEPYQGSLTCIGGLLRDAYAAGQGSLVGAVFAGYVTGQWLIREYELPGEHCNWEYADTYARPLAIRIRASDGMAEYANQFGVPIIGGYRDVAAELVGGERIESLKPTVYGAHQGYIQDSRIKKSKPRKGMVMVRIGGPAFPIGIGGGIASSVLQGTRSDSLDMTAVQRGDGEMGNKARMAILDMLCLKRSVIQSIHDQGAGGLCNLLSELVEKVGGEIDLSRVTLGDLSMTSEQIWTAEFQESFGILAWPKDLRKIKAICRRQNVPCDVVGKVTGNKRLVVRGRDRKVMIDLPLEKVLTNVPPKVHIINSTVQANQPLIIPKDLNLGDAIRDVLRSPAICSTADLQHKGDRAVGGCVVLQPCVGGLQMPIADVGITSATPHSKWGTVTALGHNYRALMVDPESGARMCLAKAMWNMAGAVVANIRKVHARVNWMWPAKLPGEGARINRAARALVKLEKRLGIQNAGGKDSSSLAAKVGGKLIKAPGQIVVGLTARMPNVRKFVTPDIKKPGQSRLALIDVSKKNRLGGSAFAQTLRQHGDINPDVDNPKRSLAIWKAIQGMVKDGLILAYHDRVGAGGLAANLFEMIMAGNCGATISIKGKNVFECLFAEEEGGIIEYEKHNEAEIKARLLKAHAKDSFVYIGKTTRVKSIELSFNDRLVLVRPTKVVRSWYEETTTHLEREQIKVRAGDESVVDAEQSANWQMLSAKYRLTFTPRSTSRSILSRRSKPRVAVFGTEGSNGWDDMINAWTLAGFHAEKVMLSDMLQGRLKSLSRFQALASVGGFSHADVPESGRAWAGAVRFNDRARDIIGGFVDRSDTISFHVCNGFQWATLVGLLPFRGLEDSKAPRLVHNVSRKFESRFATVRIENSPSIFFTGMEGSVLGAYCGHGEGQVHFPDPRILSAVEAQNLVPLRYVDPEGMGPTEQYPWNPNGSVGGIGGFVTACGRHHGQMAHFERGYLLRQLHWIDPENRAKWKASPLLRVFQNAYAFVS